MKITISVYVSSVLFQDKKKMDVTQERMDANTKAMQERMERQIGSLVTIMEASRKTERDEMKQEIRAGQYRLKIECDLCNWTCPIN
jgi:DNA integrity scanning protein DisA with diadenylate cyclase activity